jgi:catechol 2,3-dioxygenase-like lactoylglutathione lyase family enzyme
VFDHVTIRVSNREASERFYDTVLRPLERDAARSGKEYAEWDDFSLAETTTDKPVTRGLHVGFSAPSREHVREFWQVGVDAGYRSDGEPGLRPQYSEDYYGAFLLDPDGNSAEAVHHDDVGQRAGIDHLWMRVADLAASKRFYETIAPYTGFAFHADRSGRSHFRGAGSSFAVVAGTPTEHVHLAFPADDNAVVDEFHAAATGMGYRDNGMPGERAIYHEGYYGAFVLDPDGNNVEVVSHNR